MVRLRDIGQWSGGNTPSKANPAYWTDGTVPWVSPKDMKVDEIASSEDRITTKALDDGRVSLLPEGSILVVTRSGILAHTLPVAVTKMPVTINQDLKALTPKAGISPKYVALAVKSASQRILKACSKHGTTVASVDTNALLDFEIPVVDLAQQHAIVAEIEKQCSRLDEAIANLERVRASLRRYERSVLSTMVGVSASAQAECGLPALPSGWEWRALPELGELGRGKSKHRPRDDARLYGGPYPFVQTGDVRRSGGVVREFTQTYSEFGLSQSRLWPEGTLCITIAANIAETGILAMPACFPDSVVGFLSADQKLTRFVELFMRVAREDLERFAPATAQKNINLAILERVLVPVPPPEERARIVAEVDRRLSIVRGVEAEVDANLKRAARLREAVLQRAFSGELLASRPQPASPPRLTHIPGTTTLRASARLALSAEIVHCLHQEPTFGQRKHQKVFHLCEHIARLDMLQSPYRREAAGPADLRGLHANEAALKRQGWYEEQLRDGGPGHRYLALGQAGQHRAYLDCFSAEQLSTVRRLIELMRTWDTDRCEIFSTTYAAWNDLIVLQQPVTDAAIVREVWDCWDSSKRRFPQKRWHEEIAWMRREGFVPTGFGLATRGATEGMSPLDLFPSAEP
jgi:type I restriction enzyme S subunit